MIWLAFHIGGLGKADEPDEKKENFTEKVFSILDNLYANFNAQIHLFNAENQALDEENIKNTRIKANKLHQIVINRYNKLNRESKNKTSQKSQDNGKYKARSANSNTEMEFLRKVYLFLNKLEKACGLLLKKKNIEEEKLGEIEKDFRELRNIYNKNFKKT